MPNISTNSNVNVKSGFASRKLDWRVIALFALLALVGGIAISNLTVLLVLAGLVVAFGVGWLALVYVRRTGLEVWQVFTLIAISGYLLLNYGFENLTIHVGGFPFIVGYALMYGALIMAVLYSRHLIARALQEPAVMCVAAFLVLAFCHLIFDIPQYGLWAVRDATICLDGMFMVVGLAWAMKPNSIVTVSKWLLAVFFLNMLLGFTQPWQEHLWNWSPESGVFLPVPVFGNYNGIGDILVAGALFCICVGSFVIKRPSWLMQALAAGQFLGMAIAQVRRMYVATAVVLLLLLLLGEGKKFAKLFILVPTAIVAILLVTVVGGVQINGRIGPVDLNFFKDHLRSIETSEGTPGSAVESRYIMVDEAMQHFYANPVLGFGFGQPLLSEVDQRNGAIGRVPHDSSVTYMVRLGSVGLLVWIAFHFSLFRRFVYAFQQRSSANPQVYAFVLWYFLYYILIMITSFVEAPFEFPSGAVPFFFFTGYALGLIRWQLPETAKGNSRWAAAPVADMATV
jgi:O-antigen ligase